MPTPTECDVLVIGGGIHGVGVAQAAAAAGWRTVLVEQRALAAGTSCRSSKLIHGGLRYLESGQFRLVRESLHERELLLKLAPSLVRRQPFFIPVYPHTTRRPPTLRAGLTLYWLLAGCRRYTGFASIPRAEWERLDGISTNQLQSVFQYWDAQTDDRKLTQAVMASAQSLGAELICPGELVRGELRGDHCRCELLVDGQARIVTSAVVVNAAGPWASQIVQRITPAPPAPAVELVGGTHLELPGNLERGCYYLEAPQDRRAVFVMPWYGRTLVGTTERSVPSPLPELVPTPDEVEYLLTVYRHYFPGRAPEVLDAWAGLRVLPSGNDQAFGRSRETQLPALPASRPRIISIFGGKLTAYRATAEKVLRALQPSLPPVKAIANTRELMLQ